MIHFHTCTHINHLQHNNMSEAQSVGHAILEEQAKHRIRNEYYFRLLISVAAASTLVSFIEWSVYNLKFDFFFFWLVYPHIPFLLEKKLPHKQHNLSHGFALADAFLLGSLINLIDFSLLPAILFFTIIQCQSLITGGVRKWAEAMALYAVGMGSAFLYNDAQLNPLSDMSGMLASLAGICVYFVMHSFMLYNNINENREDAEKIEKEQQDLRMKTWKLSRYVSPQVWQAVFSGQDVKLETKRKYLTVFFSDIKGFSELSEHLDPEELTRMLNEYLTEMSKVVHKHGGTIDKFIGDAIMVFFGDPQTKGPKEDCLAALAMAVEMKRVMKDMQHHWSNQGITMPLEIRMGINSGYCTVGNFGTEQRMDYTLLGTEVNLASRLEGAAPPGEILISHDTFSLIKDKVMCRDRGKIKVKGFAEPVQVYQVVDFRSNLGTSQTYFEQRMDGFTLYMDMEKIKNYEKENIIKQLLSIATKLKNKVH